MERDRHELTLSWGFSGHMVRCFRFVQLQSSVSNLMVMDTARVSRENSCFRVGGDHSITWMELLPIVLLCIVWGAVLRGQRVTIYCDNLGVVAVCSEFWLQQGT